MYEKVCEGKVEFSQPCMVSLYLYMSPLLTISNSSVPGCLLTAESVWCFQMTIFTKLFLILTSAPLFRVT